MLYNLQQNFYYFTKNENKYSEGFIDGIKTIYYPTGKIKAIGYLESNSILWADIRKGFWIEYDENGNKKAEGVYKKGSRRGFWIYYLPDGTGQEKIIK